MSKQAINTAIRKYGNYAGVRFLRNNGVRFEDAYMAVFNREPRL
jgi:hypothetical protein